MDLQEHMARMKGRLTAYAQARQVNDHDAAVRAFTEAMYDATLIGTRAPRDWGIPAGQWALEALDAAAASFALQLQFKAAVVEEEKQKREEGENERGQA